MRAGGGKSKGAGWEREVSVLLSRWVSSGGQDDVYWRSSMSGGRATVGFRKGKQLGNQVGDLSCIDPIGQRFLNSFAVEAKYYADLDYIGLITGKGKLLAFWAEINEQAGRYQKHPFMIVRQNRMKPHICLDLWGIRELGLHDSDSLLISIPYNLYLIDADYFVSVCKPYI
jgi:hypothetical protein